MTGAKVIVDYSTNRYSDSELIVKSGTISTNLADNVAFPTLKEFSVTLKEDTTSFSTLVSKMGEGNKQMTLAKNQSRKKLEITLGTGALKVQDLSGGDEKLILSAGFDVKRKPAPIGLLDRPANVMANAGPVRGSLEISWDVVPNAYIYEVQFTEAPSNENSKWSRTSNTKRKIVLDNLTRGKAYAIQVAAAGSDPGRVWSDEIISYVM